MAADAVTDPLARFDVAKESAAELNLPKPVILTKKNQSEAKIAQLRQELADLESKLVSVHSELAELKHELEIKRQLVEDFNASQTTAADTVREEEARRSELEEKIRRAQQKADQLRKRLDEASSVDASARYCQLNEYRWDDSPP